MPRNPATICVSKTVVGQGAAGGQEDVEVLGGRVGHRDARAVEDVGQRGGVDGERIDEGHPVGPGDLDQSQVGHVRPLGVELGVERVVLLAERRRRPAPQARASSTIIGRRGASRAGAARAGPVAVRWARRSRQEEMD